MHGDRHLGLDARQGRAARPPERRPRGRAGVPGQGAGRLPRRPREVRLHRRAAGRADDRPLAHAARAARAERGGRDGDGRRAVARAGRRAHAGARTAWAARAGCRRRSCCSPTARAPAAPTRSTSPRGPRRRACASTRSRSAPPSGVLETQQPDGTTRTREGAAGHADAARDRPHVGRRSSTRRPNAAKLEAGVQGLATKFSTVQEKQEVTAAFAGGGAGAAARRAGAVDAARGAAALMARRLRSVPPRPSARRSGPGPGPVPPAVLRSLDLAVMRRVESLVPGRAPDAAGGRRHRPGDDPALPAGRRRPPHRLERHRAHARAARARARGRARADRVAAARRVGLDDVRDGRPPQGGRRRGRRAGDRPRRHPPRQPARRALLRRRRASRACCARARAGVGLLGLLGRAAPRARRRRRGSDVDRRRGHASGRAGARTRAGRAWSPTSAARATGRARCARCAGATACSPWRSATRARWS